MLGDISGLEKIYIVCGYTDMRKSIDGLCAVIEDQLKMDPSSSALFLFCGRRWDLHSFFTAFFVAIHIIILVFLLDPSPQKNILFQRRGYLVKYL